MQLEQEARGGADQHRRGGDMSIDVFLALVLRVVSGILAIQAPSKPVSQERATLYAVAATYHGLRAGVDPFELVAIARNESDFVEGLRGPDGKDCGLTQTRTTITRFTCRQLLRSSWLAFQEAAREMKEYAAACRGHGDFDRCRMNHYNSGARYARRGFHGAYWLRVECFAAAARAGIPVENDCRAVQRPQDIARVLRRAAARSPALALAASPSS
jgi:hypothetical protein